MSYLGAQNSIALGVQGLIHIDTGGGAGGSADYLLAKSLRFRSSASAYLNRTASATISTYTISMWVKRGIVNTADCFLFSYPNSGATDAYGIGFNSPSPNLYIYGGGTATTTTAVYRDPASWYHIILVNNAGAMTTYVNGVSVATSASFAAIPSGSVMNIGRYNIAGGISYFDGEMAEVNFVDGQALLPASFGASSIYNQWLPIKYAGTYGTNGFYLPFSGGTATSYAGSFNGSSQYISVTPNTSLQFGSGDFTIECWVYKSANGSTYDGICQLGTNSSGNDGFYLIASSTATGYEFGSQGVAICSYNGSIRDSQWHHIAVSRTGTTTRMFIDGVQRSSYGSTYTIPSTATVLTSGVFSSSYYYLGYISNLRLIKGTGLYTANFVPPTSPLTAVSGTSLLTLQNATIVDNSTNAFTITNTGTVVTSVQSPFLNPTVLTADSSGNANNWTPNNISLTAGSTYDSLTDVPTLTSTTVANYPVWNILRPSQMSGGTATISNGNLTVADGFTSSGIAAQANVAVSSGKWYWEVTATTVGGLLGGCGIRLETLQDIFGLGYFYYSDGNKTTNINGGGLAYGASYTSGNVLGVALDLTAGTLEFYKNNVSQGIAYTGLSGLFSACVGDGQNATRYEWSINFGQQPFVYTPPSGFVALNTFNIAAGTVTTSGTFTGNLSTDGPFVFLNGTPTALTINSNPVTFGTQADKLANGFKVRSSSSSYNLASPNTYVATTVGAVFKYEDAQANP